MVPQQIARIVEETVNNLRELETRLDVLRTDLALLCQSIGHPEAAQKVLTARAAAQIAQVGMPNIAAANPAFNPNVGAVGGVNPAYGAGVATPFANVSPFANAAPFANVSPWANVASAASASPWANASPFSAANPWAAVSPYTAANPWANVASAAATNPWANVSPFGAANPWANVSPFAVGSVAANPFASTNPYGSAAVAPNAWAAPWTSGAFSSPYAFPR